jgi:hypothetical protein
MKAPPTLDPQGTVMLAVVVQRECLDIEIGVNPVARDESEKVLRRGKQLLELSKP